MTKEKLIDKIRALLKTDNDLRFLVELKKEDFEMDSENLPINYP